MIATRLIPSITKFLGYVPEILGTMPQLRSPLFLYRVKHGISQREVAKLIGIDKTTVHAIELGGRTMLAKTQSKLQRQLDSKCKKVGCD